MLKDCSIFFAVLLLACQMSYAANNAQFISQSVPSAMEPGQTYSVSVSFKNTGTIAWTEAGQYRLGAQGPQDNGNWGFNRVYLSSGESVAPGQSKTFTFSITSPITPGKYNFQWQMVQEYVQWFGNYSTNVVVPVKNYALMEKIKKKGCIFESLLSSAGADTDSSIEMLDRSQCEYLHRSIETWTYPPDFSLIQANLNKIHKTGIIQGMFIAEAISTSATYYYPDESRNFNFASMCAPGTTGQWGANTCIPSFKTAEYRKYVGYITKKAIDMGITDYGFGQIYLMEDTSERSHLTNPYAPQIVLEMREYARSKGKIITVGAQSNDIADETYLRNFDYIWGGVGEDVDGSIESGTCSTHFTGFCWALLWHDYWASKANDVLIHFDWYSSSGDDMNTFARMSTGTKEQFLMQKYDYFTNTKGMSFLMPFRGIPLGSGIGCWGENIWAYSADNKYTCRDEDVMNYVLSGASSVTVSGTVKKSTGQGISNVLIDMCGGLATQTDSSGSWSKNVSFGQAYCARIASGLPMGYSSITGTNNTNCYTGASSYEWQYAGKDVYESCSYSDQRSWDLSAIKDAGINFIVLYPTTTTTTTTTTSSSTTTSTSTTTTRTTSTSSTTSTTTSSTSTTSTTTSTSSTSTSSTITSSSTMTTTRTSTSTTSTTSSTTSTTLTNTSTTTTTSSTTTQSQCIMPGNYPPCDEITLAELVDAINRWIEGEYNLGDLIDLIDSWADPVGYTPN
jgi:hypothetical protein